MRCDLARGIMKSICRNTTIRDIPMSISQTLFDAIGSIEAELLKRGEYGEVLGIEIAALLKHMKDVQRKLDSELTEIDTAEEK
jgi:hypothetical protein